MMTTDAKKRWDEDVSHVMAEAEIEGRPVTRELAESIVRGLRQSPAGMVAQPTPGTVRIGRNVVPATRSVLGDVLVEHLGVWHTVPTFVALTFREKVSA